MTVIKSVTCPICGCLCDDIEVTVENNEVVKMKNGCAVCEGKFLGYKGEHRIKTPLMRKDGKLVPVTMKEAVHAAAEVLANAKYPILYGWSSTSSEAQRVGVELTEESRHHGQHCCRLPWSFYLRCQEVGFPLLLLGKLDTALILLFTGVAILGVHTQDLERYTNFTEGRFEKSEWNSYMQKLKAHAAEEARKCHQNRRLKKISRNLKLVMFGGAPPDLSKGGSQTDRG